MSNDLIDKIMKLLSLISCFCSLILILIYLNNKILHKNSHNEIIFYIGICDLLSSIGGSFGLVNEGTIQCQIQAILTNIFPISGIFWTTILVYIMIGIVANKRVVKIITWKYHLIGWIFPIIITLLPLTTNRYGILGGDRGWCFIDRLDSSPHWSTLFWMITSFYLWIWTSELFFALFLVYIVYIIYVKNFTYSSSSSRYYKLLTLVFYPISTFVCWILPCYSDIFSTISNHFVSHNNTGLNSYAFFTPFLQGILTLLIFIIMNHDVTYFVLHCIDNVIYYLTCCVHGNLVRGSLMRYYSSRAAANGNGSNQNGTATDNPLAVDNYGLSPTHQSQRNMSDDILFHQQTGRPRMTSQESASTEYEIKGTFKESYDECSVVIC